jgi:hypothetical protein
LTLADTTRRLKDGRLMQEDVACERSEMLR